MSGRLSRLSSYGSGMALALTMMVTMSPHRSVTQMTSRSEQGMVDDRSAPSQVSAFASNRMRFVPVEFHTPYGH